MDFAPKLANVFFSLPSFPYILTLFMPSAGLVAMITEFAIFRAFQNKVRFGVLLALVLGANVFSWFLGIFLTALLPGVFFREGGAGGFSRNQSPIHDSYAFYFFGFLLACIASIVLELAFLLALKKRLGLPLERLPLCVTVANLGSYSVLLLWLETYLRF